MKPRNRLTLSHESLRAELDEIVERHPAHFGDERSALTREETVKRFRKLGFTEGDALRWLGFETTRWGAAFASGRCMIRLRLAHFIHYWADRIEGGETYRQRVRRRLRIAA
jgi:hypothetical protein